MPISQDPSCPPGRARVGPVAPVTSCRISGATTQVFVQGSQPSLAFPWPVASHCGLLTNSQQWQSTEPCRLGQAPIRWLWVFICVLASEAGSYCVAQPGLKLQMTLLLSLLGPAGLHLLFVGFILLHWFQGGALTILPKLIFPDVLDSSSSPASASLLRWAATMPLSVLLVLGLRHLFLSGHARRPWPPPFGGPGSPVVFPVSSLPVSPAPAREHPPKVTATYSSAALPRARATALIRLHPGFPSSGFS